eukprot:407523_1
MSDSRNNPKKPLNPIGLTQRRVSLALQGNTKPDKWNKILESAEVSDSIDKFCNTKEIKLLVATWDSAGNLVTSNCMPRGTIQAKKKSMALFKTRAVALSVANYNEYIFNIEYTSNPLENLSVLSRGIFLPLIKNSANRDQWSVCVSQKILFEFNQFISDLYVIVGESKGETLLALPPNEIYSPTITTEVRLAMLEQILIQWTRSMKSAIYAEPNTSGNPDPLDELKFWSEKSRNLSNIGTQLRDQNTARMISSIRCSTSELER